jgi:peptide/nickel transport system substrate-binding protein
LQHKSRAEPARADAEPPFSVAGVTAPDGAIWRNAMSGARLTPRRKQIWFRNHNPSNLRTTNFDTRQSLRRLGNMMKQARLGMMQLAVATCLLLGAQSFAYAQEKSLTYANLSGPSTLDPYMAGAIVEVEVVNQIFEGLVTIDEKYNPRLMLAQKVDVSGDYKKFTFALRPGVKFHNGKVMSSADVLASFKRYAAVSPNASLVKDAKFEAPDASTFVVTFENANPLFITALSTPLYPLVILPSEQEEKPAREAEAIGTGPLRVEEWRKDSHLVLAKFADYAPDTSAAGPDGYGGKKSVFIDKVRYNFVPEANARVAALQSGGADIISAIPPDLTKRFANDKRITKQETFPWAQAAFFMQSQYPPTDNVELRRAIQALVNVDDVMAAGGQLSRRNPSMIYATSPYYDAKVSEPYYNIASVEKAKALLKQAGYKGEKVVLLTNSNYPFHRDAILVLSESMKAAGINAEVQVVDWLTNSNHIQRGTGNWNISTTTFTPAPLLGPQQWRNQMYNFAQIKNDTVLDDAYKKFLSSPAEADRKAAWAEIEKRVMDQAYFVKIGDYGAVNAYGAKIKAMRPWFLIRFTDLEVQ